MRSKKATPVLSATFTDQIDRFDGLVEELMKQKPQEERIKAYMKDVGLEYSADPIARLNLVLQALEGKEKFR